MIKNIKSATKNNIMFFIILFLFAIIVIGISLFFLNKTNEVTTNKQIYTYLAKYDFSVQIVPSSEDKAVKGQCVYEVNADFAKAELMLNDNEVKVYLPDIFKKNSTEFTVYSVGHYENHLQVIHRDIKVNSDGDLIFKKSGSSYLKKYVISRKDVPEDNKNDGNNNGDNNNNNNSGDSNSNNNNGDNNTGGSGTQEEKTPDGTIPGGDIAELDRLDFINAKKSAYEKYISKGDEYGEQIAQKKSFLSMSYDLLKGMLSKIGDNPDNLPFVYGQTLGLNTKHQISQGGTGSKYGGFIWPVELVNPGAAKITSLWGYQNDRAGFITQNHAGIDIGRRRNNTKYIGCYRRYG